MLFKGNSSRLELLIEKIQANKENHHVTEQDIKDALGTDPGSSWRSETPEDATSPSPSSCATPNSATDVPDSELTFTVGVTESTPYPCQFCDKAFPRLSYLKKHEQTHSDQMPFRCEFCSRLFKHKRSRDRHIKLHTGDKKYRCSHCEAAFSRSDHLKIHMKTHDNQKPFQCTVCNRGYNTAAALTSHMQNHKKEQQQQHNGANSNSSSNTPSPGSFRCLQCGDTFRKPDELQSHMVTQHRVDTSPPPLPVARELLGGLIMGESSLTSSQARPLTFQTPKLACIYCTKDSFTTMEALQLHVQAMHGSILNGEIRDYGGHLHHHQPPSTAPSPHHHTSPTASLPYSCELCTMRFNSLQGLQKHALGVHGLAGDGVAPLYCMHCSLPFPSAALFAEHYVLMHGGGSSTSVRMSSSPPSSSEQLKPTDLSKKSRRHNNQQSPPNKRLKESTDVSAPETSTTMNQYDQPGTLLCNQCGAALPDFESFRTHLKSHLEEAGGLRGLLGGGGTDLLAMLAASSEQRVKSPALPCPHCGAKFSSPEDHQQHLASHFLATATEYGCQSCLKLFSKPDELQKHLMDIHAHHLYRCSLCKEMFDSKVAIQVHFAVKHSNECKLYRCTACPLSSAVFRSEMDFGLHVRTIHHHPPPPLPLSPTKLPSSASQQQFRCLFCRLSFPTEHDMQFHLTVHSKQFHCPFCQEGFHVEFLLDKHMQTHHTTQVLSSSSSNGVDNPSQQKSPKSKPSSGGNPSNSMATIGNNNTSLNINNNNSSRGSSSDNGVASKIPESAKNCCDICDRRDFASESELTAHRKLVHHVKTAGAGGGKNGAVSLHCAYCSENCKSRTELENHMKTHSQGSGGSGKHKCNICDELCPSAAILAEHKLTHCKVVSGSVCTQCKSNLVSEEQFYSHLQQHGGGGANNSTHSPQQVALPTPCVVCRQTLISDIEVRMHARFHLKNSEPTYQCFLCLKQFESQNLVVANGGHQTATYVCKECYHCHSKTSPSPGQEQAFRCPECQVKFETSSALEAHLVTVHKKTYQCIKCQISFETEREIQLHVATHLLTEGSSHECHLCRRLLSTPLKLQAHLIEHTFAGCGSYTCYLCSAVFTASQGLQQHMLEHGLAARPYDCSRCSLRFFFRAELDNHSYSHLEEAMVEGSGALIDGGDLATKAAFYHHLTTNGSYDPSPDLQYYKTLRQDPVQHKPHRPKGGKSGPKEGTFRCSECGKEFSSALGLQAHQRHHNKHSRRSCVECNKEFSSARNLGVHMRAHHPGEHSSDDRTSDEKLEGVKQERVLPCTVCQKEFLDVDSLEVHVLSQHSRCPHCGEAFLHQTLCVQHIAHAHPESVAIKQEPAVIKQEDEEDLDVASLSAPPAAEEHYGPGLDEASVDVVGDASSFNGDTRKDDSSTNQSEVNNSVTSCEDSDDVDKRQ